SADLIGAENQLTDALVRRIAAETSQRIAIADLRRTLGLPQFQETSDEPPPEETSSTTIKP
ncbi:MAG TPA: hypothetical protein DEQ20_08720, partial [Desulfobulbaceae bacterium]|nr:hypothetical protein [Desulfobulbaceae bacterium]